MNQRIPRLSGVEGLVCRKLQDGHCLECQGSGLVGFRKKRHEGCGGPNHLNHGSFQKPEIGKSLKFAIKVGHFRV